MNFYDVLEVHPKASADVLRAAYRALVKQVHPDVPGGDRKRFEEVEAAWRTLSDPAKRAAYDATLKPGAAPPFEPKGKTETTPDPAPADDLADDLVRAGFGLFAKRVGVAKAGAALDIVDALARLRGR